MKKKNSELIRITNTLEADRLSVGDNFYNLVSSDIKKVLGDYFSLIDTPAIEVVKVGGRLLVTVKASAERVKGFINLPKD